MTYSYEESVWGKGTAGLQWSNPASFRLDRALMVVDDAVKAGNAGETQKTVLEIGCGAGQFIRAIKKLRPSLDCFGCDISNAALTSAKTYNDGVRYDVSGDTLPYDDKTFDVVCIFDVLEHVQSPDAILQEVRRVLKPQGLLYAFIPCEGDKLSLLGWLYHLKLIPNLSRRYAGHINHWSRAMWANTVTNAGLPIEKKWYSGHVLGQIIDVSSFMLMDRAAKKMGGAQINNEAYFLALEARPSKNILNVIKKIVNSCMYLESALFKYVPSSNLHIVARKV